MRDSMGALCLAILVGCTSGNSAATDDGGRPDGVAPDGTSAGITLAGKLVAGVQTAASSALQFQPASLPPGAKHSALASGDPLVGYQLYCVTFASPPTAATGTADATGQVTLDLDAAGVAFGCFVLDAEGEAVATLIFTDGAQRGQTLTLTGDTDLGSITVDLDNGVAQTEVAPTGTLTPSTGLPCPLGTWVTSVPREDCPGTATVSLWFVKTGSGEYKASFTIGPIMLSDTHVCGYHSMADLATTETGGAYTFRFLDDPNCPVVYRTITATPNGDCTILTLDSTRGPCTACGEGQCECSEDGSQNCPQSFTATRQ